MKNIILTSLLAVMVAAPAFADDDPYTNDETYTGYCEIAHIGGNGSSAVTASANFSPKSYSCAAGTYLPDGDTWTAAEISADDGRRQCPANSYCGGGTYTYSEANDQGITACPTGYTLSDAGSSLQTQCYRNCAASDVDHLKSGGTMNGHYYYGDNNQCEPANENQCATGYHYVAGALDVLPVVEAAISNNAITFEYMDGRSIIQASDSANSRSVQMVFTAQCSTQSGPAITAGNSATIRSTLPDSTGQYCWCQFRGRLMDANGTQNIDTRPWVSFGDRGDASTCASSCLSTCLGIFASGENTALSRERFFRSVSPLASCQANTITINWGGYGANNTETQSTQCTYGGDVTTPTTAPTKRGNTFTGWTFTLN